MPNRSESRREWIVDDPINGSAGYWKISHHVLELTQAEIDQRALDAEEYRVALAAIAATEKIKQSTVTKLKGLGLTEPEINALWSGH